MTINVDGYDIPYRVEGCGDKVIVILQGWGTDFRTYEYFAEWYKNKYTIVRFNLPGFSDAPEPKEPWSVSDYADFVMKFLDSLGYGSVTLIGHSYGGRIAIELMSRSNPTINITDAILIGSAGIPAKKSIATRLCIKTYKLLKKYAGSLAEKWKDKVGSTDYKNASPIMRQCLVKAVNEDMTPKLSNIKQSVLLIWGENDTATPLSNGVLMEKLIPNAGLSVVKRSGHFCFLERPDVVHSILNCYFR